MIDDDNSNWASLQRKEWNEHLSWMTPETVIKIARKSRPKEKKKAEKC